MPDEASHSTSKAEICSHFKSGLSQCLACYGQALTYRLRRLPAYVERSTVANFLVRSVEGLGPPENIVIFSLASSLVHWERPPTQTATLMFKRTPERFDNDRTQWTVPLPNQGESLIFDIHFLEFTPLSSCDPGLHQFDCIAISGLASHPLGSWMHRDSETNFVWLRDRLPKDMPGIRPIIYGYDTQLVKSESVQTIDDLASSFIARLKSIGRALSSAKPLLVIAHSLGGILLRNALVQMASSGDEETFILKSIKMIILFGVPSKGMHMSHLLPMVEGQPNHCLVELLSPGSSYLSSLSQHSSNIATLHNIRLISAYETKRSRTTKKSESGNWERSGPYELLVDQQSAVQTDSSPSDCFPIDENHSDMVKFSDDSPEYRVVIGFMKSILPVVPSSATAASGSEHVEASNGQGSSRPHKSKVQKVLYSRFSSFATDSSQSEPGLYAQPNRKKYNRGRGRRNVAKAEISLREATSQHQSTEMEENLKELYDSLDFAERSHRYERIKEAHPTTFDWIFEKSELGLISWLRKGTGIYWIQGKPGSGKSTLMKFLHDHPQTSEILDQWRQGRNHTSAWFFFNERGSYIEKSFEGLLRSVVRELASKNDWLAELVLEVYFERVKHFPKREKSWQIQDLERALSAILSQREQDLEVLLFFDALDEYSGPPEMIAEFVQSLVQSVPDSKTKVKILLSSRPWDAFVMSFGQQPGLKMHEQTKGDMRIFVLDHLGTTHALAPLSNLAEDSLDPTARDVVSIIVDRAEGVFLWVRLVVKSLLGAGPDVTALQLKELLQALPNGLEELYERTIERIPRTCRLEAFIVLEIVNRAFGNLSVRQVTGAASCALGKTLEECAEILKKRFLNMDDEQAALQLKNLCGGLIETYRDGNKPTRVQFMHQTVKDFVSRPGFERRMLGRSYAPLHENGFSFLMKYGLAMRELFQYDSKEFGIVNLLHLTHRAEETTGNNQEKFLDSIGDERFPWDIERRVNYGTSIEPTSVLSFAVLGNLLLYTKQKLRTTNLVNGVLRKSLLHFVVDSIVLGHPPSSLESMTELLLEKGADIYCRYAGETPFECIITTWFLNLEKSSFVVYEESVSKVVQIFLEHGQDANIYMRGTAYEDSRSKRNRFKSKSACKPLHIAEGKVSKILLERGAHVNALDSGGLTPLDVLIRNSIHYYVSNREKTRYTASTLLEYGGCITHSTRKALPGFIVRMGNDNGEVPDNFRNPPELPMTLAQRVRSIVPWHFGSASVSLVPWAR